MAKTAENKEKKHEGERLAKVLARAGVASRRAAEALILAGRVAVNGQAIKTPAFNVAADALITVDGIAVDDKEPARLWRYHKPEGLVTTARDPQGRPTVFDYLPDHLPRVVSVGRLDLTTEGLLLLTNSGGLARVLELPKNEYERRYRVRVHGKVTERALATLARGVTIEGVRYRPAKIEMERQQGTNAWLAITLVEGKNREVKKLLDHVGLKVNRLIRVGYGPFELGKLEEGAVEEVPKRALRTLIPDVDKL